MRLVQSKEDRKKYAKIYYQNNKEKWKKWCKEYAIRNREKIKKQQKKYRIENKEKIKKYRRKHYLKNKKKFRQSYFKLRKSLEGRAIFLLRSAKMRAKKNKLDFELDFEWLVDKLRNGTCEMCGLKISYDPPKKNFHHNPYSPSIDRHDPKKGYTKGNSKVVITAYNIAKNQWNQRHFRRIIKAIYEGMLK